MADSDDEYDRKRRDKFRGERSSGDSYRSERRDDRRGGAGGGRDDWSDRNVLGRNPFRGGGGGGGGGRPRPDYRDYRVPRDRYGSPGRDLPPAKRMRPDWGDEMRGGGRYAPYDPYLMHAWNEHYAAQTMHGAYGGGGGHAHAPHPRESAINSDTPTQPAMLTLKQFLDTQDDGISDAEVLRKYTDYKLDFKRQQLNEFFVVHKDEEWFKNKYHPSDSSKRKEEQLGFLKRRVAVFEELLGGGQIKSVSIDSVQSDPLLRLLDTVVIKLEGGTDEDLRVLDEKPRDTVYSERLFDKKRDDQDDDVIITSVGQKGDDNQEGPKVVSPRPVRRSAPSEDEENWDDDTPAVVVPVAKKEAPPKAKKEKKSSKRKRTTSDSSTSSSSDSDSSSSSSSDEDDEKVKAQYDLSDIKPEDLETLPKEEKAAPAGEAVAASEAENGVPTVKDSEEAVIVEVKDAEATDTSAEKILLECEDLTITIDDNAANTPVQDEKCDSVEKELLLNTNAEDEDEDDVNGKEAMDKEALKKPPPITIDLDKVKDIGPRPCALHRTSSIFLRNLAPLITKAEIEQVCTRFDGFLRVAIADPLPERRWYRRGWVTFKRDVNIKEICWNLNNTRLRDCEMGAIVNRDLSRRVRPVNGMTAHKTIVRSDIKLCAKIAMNLDEKFRLWEQSQSNANASTDMEKAANGAGGATYGFKSNNPVLQNITDFLIEEASAEEEELLGISGEVKDSDSDGIERDPQLISVLDCLILYLRIVHSVDFYNHCEYPYEDEMPNRCGIIHARGPTPMKVTQNDLQDYMKNFEHKMQTFLAKPTTIDEEELKNLGCKDAEAEVEKFVQVNTQELAKDKWLCPLSGKKFKGPEFIRKHIFNKHGEKVDEVRKEVEFFNNYLRDPKRPQLPEHPGNAPKRTPSESSGGAGPGFRAPIFPPAYGAPYAAYAPPMMMMSGRGMRGGRREVPSDHQRRLIGYHDLDAPANFDIFD